MLCFLLRYILYCIVSITVQFCILLKQINQCYILKQNLYTYVGISKSYIFDDTVLYCILTFVCKYPLQESQSRILKDILYLLHYAILFTLFLGLYFSLPYLTFYFLCINRNRRVVYLSASATPPLIKRTSIRALAWHYGVSDKHTFISDLSLYCIF